MASNHPWQDPHAVFQPCPPERIVLCIDSCEDRQARFPSQQGGKQHPSPTFATIKKCAEAFIKNKLAMNPNHQFALINLNNKSNSPYPSTASFTNKQTELLKTLSCINAVPLPPPDQPTQLSCIFQLVNDRFLQDADDTQENLPVPLRVIILYGRSGPCCMNENVLAKFSNVTTDVLFIHRPIMSAKEKKRLTTNLMELQSCLSGTAYCAAALSDSALALDHMMRFLTHPNLR